MRGRQRRRQSSPEIPAMAPAASMRSLRPAGHLGQAATRRRAILCMRPAMPSGHPQRKLPPKAPPRESRPTLRVMRRDVLAQAIQRKVLLRPMQTKGAIGFVIGWPVTGISRKQHASRKGVGADFRINPVERRLHRPCDRRATDHHCFVILAVTRWRIVGQYGYVVAMDAPILIP